MNELLAEFHAARLIATQHARWAASDPALPPNTCRYCGRYWHRWAGSQLDGHAGCFVPDDFKQRRGDLRRAPTVTYAVIAKVIGVTPSVVRSWTAPIRHVDVRTRSTT